MLQVVTYETDFLRGVTMQRMGRLFASGDKAAHTFQVRIQNADLSGYSADGYMIRADQASVPITAKIEGDTVIATLPEACYVVSGGFSLILRATKSDERTAVFWGVGTVTRSRTDSIINVDNRVPSLEELLAQIDAVEAATNAANAQAEQLASMIVRSYTREYGSGSLASLHNEGNQKILTLGLERGQKGDKGADGTVSFDALTDAQKAMLKGEKGDKGDQGIQGIQGEKGDKGDTGNIGALKINGKSPDGAGTVTLTASDVGALATGDTALNASKFDGKTWAELLQCVYPVGSIYMSVNSASPADLFGGTWERIEGRFLVGAGNGGDLQYEPNATGGESSHLLTEAEMPVINGNLAIHGGENGSSLWNPSGVFSTSGVLEKYKPATSTAVESASSISSINFTAGNGQAHNNLPPYLAVYMWKRVS